MFRRCSPWLGAPTSWREEELSRKEKAKPCSGTIMSARLIWGRWREASLRDPDPTEIQSDRDRQAVLHSDGSCRAMAQEHSAAMTRAVLGQLCPFPSGRPSLSGGFKSASRHKPIASDPEGATVRDRRFSVNDSRHFSARAIVGGRLPSD